MAKITLRDGTVIGDYGKPYFIAEMNTSHFGSMETAKEMIKKAKEVGCSCVKFQSWSPESLYSKTYYDENPILKRIVGKFAFTEEQLFELAEYSKECGIGFSSTPYSREEVDFLVDKCKVPFVKIASMECTNYPFLEYIGKKGTPIILSTGMSSMDEIRKAVRTIEKTGNRNICILHCISIYPPEMSTINLHNILGLREEFPDYPIGFSDHSLGTEIPTAAFALGAAVLEKHFTLDKSRIGMDNQMASEPDEMALLIKQCNNVQVALGSKQRVVLEEELKQRAKMRRSVIAAKDIKKGEVIQEGFLDAKRPGTGIPPGEIEHLIGKKATRDIEKDTLLKETDLE